MNLVFDGPGQPMGLVPHSLIALLPLAVWAYRRFVGRRGSSLVWLLAAVGIFLLTNGIVFWDQSRVRRMAADGTLQVTRGIITQSWHIVSRERDWTRSTLSYRTTVSEGFDVPANFAGHMLGAGQMDDLRATLAMPALQTCLRTAATEALPDGSLRIVCHGVTLLFARAAGDAWRLRELRQGS